MSKLVARALSKQILCTEGTEDKPSKQALIGLAKTAGSIDRHLQKETVCSMP